MAIGLTATGPGQATTIDAGDRVGERSTRVQATCNLLEPSAGPALERAHAAGMGVIVKEALANGRLTARGDQPASRRSQEAARADALALAHVLARPWVDVVLSGAATAEQLRSNLAARTAEWSDAFEERTRGLAIDPDEYWSQRSDLEWN